MNIELLTVPDTQCILNFSLNFACCCFFLIITWRKVGDKNTQMLTLAVSGLWALDEFYLPHPRHLHIL